MSLLYLRYNRSPPKTVEGFQEEVLTRNALSQILEGADQTEIIDKLLDKYQDLLKSSAQNQADISLSKIECQEELNKLRLELKQALESARKYRERVRIQFPDYVRENFIRKEKLLAEINASDVTKHPDFQEKCSKSEFFDIQKHQDYQACSSCPDPVPCPSCPDPVPCPSCPDPAPCPSCPEPAPCPEPVPCPLGKVTEHPDFKKESQKHCANTLSVNIKSTTDCPDLSRIMALLKEQGETSQNSLSEAPAE